MRQPTFSRRRTRQQRLMRTAIGVVAVVAIIAVIGNLLGGDEPEQQPGDPVAVSFTTKVQGYTNAGKPLKPREPARDDVQEQADEIKKMLDDWYQRAWVELPEEETEEPDTYPEVAELFIKDAQADFRRDIDSLTIGKGRADIARVDTQEATADVAVYLEDGDEPTFAVVRVRFIAVGTPTREGAQPIDIEQTARYNLEKTGDGWRVVFYNANQTQESRPVPTASPTT